MRKIVKALFFSTLIFLLVPLSAVSAQESNDLNTRSGGASVDVTVPSELNILMKADGDNLVSSYEIINNGAPIKLTGIDIQKAGEWSLVSDESQLTPDAHKLIFKLGGTILKEGNNNTDITIKTGETFTPEFSVERGLITKSEETTAFKLTLKYEIIETKLINGSEFNKILLGAIQGKYNKLTFSNKPISHFDTNNIGESYDVSEKQDGSIIMYVITGTTFGEDGLEHSNEIIITNQIERQKIIFNEDSSHMFEMVGGSIDQFIIDGEYADLSLVEDMSYMFAGDYYGEQLFFTGNAQFIDTSTPKLANIDGMFKDAVFSGKMPDLSGLGFSKVESANYLFENVVSQGPFDFSFSDFKSLKFIDGIFKNFGTYYDVVLDTSSLDASNVVSMNEAFKVNSSVNTIKTPININAKAEMNDITDKVWYDETDNYRMYVAGTFPMELTESHTLTDTEPEYKLLNGKDFNVLLTERDLRSAYTVFTNKDLMHGFMLAFPDEAEAVEGMWDDLKAQITDVFDVSEKQDGSIMAYWMPTTGALVITNQNENFKIKFNENSSYMFYDTSLTLTFDENGTDFSDVETMSYMFAFPEVDPGGTHRISNLSFPQSDTSNLLSTSHMFENAALMDGDKIDLSGLDFSNVEDASYMYASFMLSDGYIDYNWSSFANVKNIEGILKDFFFINIPDDELPVVIDISGLNAYNITNMSYAFNGIRVDAVEDKYDEISIKTPYNIQEAIDTGNISSVNLYDIDDNYKEYPAGTFPTGITESHILTAKAPDQ